MNRTEAIALLLVCTFSFTACSRESARPETAAGGNRADVNASSRDGRSGASSATPGTLLKVGQAFPAYSATTLSGQRWDLSALSGNPILLNVWATWCGPCRHETPELVRLHEQYATKGLQIIGISIDEPDSKTAVEDFVREYEVNYPIVLDPGGKILEMSQASIVPYSILIDRAGKVSWVKFGMFTDGDPELRQKIEALLKETAR